MSRRLSLLLAPLACAAVAPATAHAAPRTALGGWNLGEQHAVRQAGLMRNFSDQAFHGEQRLSGRQLPDALHTLAYWLRPPPAAAPPPPRAGGSFDPPPLPPPPPPPPPAPP